MLAKGGFILKEFVSNVSGVLSTLNRKENPNKGIVKALAVEDESCHFLGLEWNYRFDTTVVRRRTTPDRKLSAQNHSRS